jgi:tRNA(Arg) A34 adenosine deaminase TadA
VTTIDVNTLIGARLDESGALARAVDLARINAEAGQLPFAALVLRDGVVLGAGANTVRADHDPSAHGEVAAVRDAARRQRTPDLTGTVVYSSCEPCAICRLAAAAAGIGEIVFAAGKALVPEAIDPDPALTGRLADAVTAVLPGIARAGTTAADPAAPFAAFARQVTR